MSEQPPCQWCGLPRQTKDYGGNPELFWCGSTEKWQSQDCEIRADLRATEAERDQLKDQVKKWEENQRQEFINWEKLQAERDALKAKLEASQHSHTESFIEAQIERDALRARVAQLEEAIRWYGDISNYLGEEHGCGDSKILNDDGFIARAALATKEAP